MSQLSSVLCNFCVRNKELNSINLDNFNCPILANFIVLRFRSWIVNNLCKRADFQLSYLTSNIYVTNQVLVRINLANFNYPILANFVLLFPRSLIVHNLRKIGMSQLSYVLSNFCVSNQELNGLSIDNFNCPILANFIPLHYRSWIVHNLRKRAKFQFSYLTCNICVTNQVLVHINLGNFISTMFANVVLLRPLSWIVHKLRNRSVLAFLTNEHLLHQNSTESWHSPQQLQFSRLGKFCSIMLSIMDHGLLAQKTSILAFEHNVLPLPHKSSISWN